MPADDLQKRSIQFSKKVFKAVQSLPNSVAIREVTRQLVRAVTSIGANLIEGKGGSSKRDFLNYLYIARKSSYETEYWLELLRENGLPQHSWESLHTECTTLTKILTSIILKLQKQTF